MSSDYLFIQKIFPAQLRQMRDADVNAKEQVGTASSAKDTQWMAGEIIPECMHLTSALFWCSLRLHVILIVNNDNDGSVSC